MTYVHANTRRSEQGFTLVELAIVMVIIGLLIGGILKGQELIANAKISGTVTQVKGLDAAINTFQDKYNALPGDMPDAATRLPNCGTGNCVNGAGGGTIAGVLTAPTAVGNEQVLAFIHLSAADLISGIDANGTAPVNFGQALPTVKAGGGMWLGYGTPFATAQANRHYAVLNGTVGATGGTNGALSATTAAQIDRKLDDGQPRAGNFQVDGTGCASGTASNSTYTENSATAVCSAFARVLN